MLDVMSIYLKKCYNCPRSPLLQGFQQAQDQYQRGV